MKTACALASMRCCSVVEEWMASRKIKKRDGFVITQDTRTAAFLPKDLFEEDKNNGYRKNHELLELQGRD